MSSFRVRWRPANARVSDFADNACGPDAKDFGATCAILLQAELPTE